MTEEEFKRRYRDALHREELCPSRFPLEWAPHWKQLAHRIATYFPEASNDELQIIHCVTQLYCGE